MARQAIMKQGIRTVTLQADVTYTIGDFLNSPTVFMSETGKKRFLHGVEVFRALNDLPLDAEPRYRITGIPSANTVQISLRIGDDGVINEEVTLKQFREGWFGQEHHPWLFCDSWAAYESGQEPDYLNGGSIKTEPNPIEKADAAAKAAKASDAASKYTDAWSK